MNQRPARNAKHRTQGLSGDWEKREPGDKVGKHESGCNHIREQTRDAEVTAHRENLHTSCEIVSTHF